MLQPMDVLKSSAHSSSPAKASWFEFLLNPNLLERHLSNSSSDPPPIELIIQFLHNAAGSSPCLVQSEPFGSNGNNLPVVSLEVQTHMIALPDSQDIQQQSYSVKEQDSVENGNHKAQALKLLALQVAAFLEWNLNEFENRLPLPMQEVLLVDLLKTVTNNASTVHVEWKDTKEMSPDAIFALFLYHRWVLRTVILESFPSRIQRGLSVQIPGQVDPCSVPADVQEHLLKRLKDLTQHSAQFLENLINDYRDLRMPVFKCIGVMTEDIFVPVHKWEDGSVLQHSDVVCQAAYDVGCYYFYQGNYVKAKEFFLKTNELYGKLEKCSICKLNPKKLQGYMQALTETHGINTVAGKHQEDNTFIKQLIDENFKTAAPVSFREEFEIDVLQNYGEDSLFYFKAAVCNAIHRALEGKVLPNNLSSILHDLNDAKIRFLIEALNSAIKKASPLQMSFLKNMIITICFTLPNIVSKLETVDVLKPLLHDMMYFRKCHESHSKTMESIKIQDRLFTGDSAMQIKQLEKELLVAHDVQDIDAIIHQLRSSGNCRPLWNITNKWELPKMFTSHLKSLPPGLDQDYFYVLLAKATELRSIKCYAEAQQLYLKVQKETAEMLPLMGRVISWEILYTNLLHNLGSSFVSHDYQLRELLQEAKNCVSVFLQEREFSPRLEVVELCLAFLLNLREWDFLSDLEQQNEGCIEFASVLASVCRDTYLNKGSRAASKELWDGILPIFSQSSVQYKRTAAGISREIQRESSLMSRMAFVKFITKLKDTVALGILISCLAKLFNVLKDDSSNDIYVEYPSLWPVVISNSNTLNLDHVSDTLQSIIQHALTEHPNHPSWLKIQGDFLYIEGHYSAALKQYLAATMVSSDYFNKPVPRPLFDDLVFHRMIHCCSKLHCHTQAAVLNQFLEEPNYGAAFKALGERLCNDSCDSYYNHIWDVTLLEFLVNLHSRRSEIDRKQLVIQILGLLEINSNNNSEIQKEAANLRKGRFLRALARQYL